MENRLENSFVPYFISYIQKKKKKKEEEESKTKILDDVKINFF